jgi:hypothetical protein
MMPASNSGDFDQGNNLPTKGFTKQQKIGLFVLLVVTLVVIVMWYLQLQKNIVYPLYGGMSPEELAKQGNNNTVTTTASLTNNGVKADPNCPPGEVCSNGVVISQNIAPELLQGATSTSQAGSQLNLDVLNQLQTPTSSQALGAGLSTADASTLKQAFGVNPDPKTLRQSFLDAATKNQDNNMIGTINGMTDAQLLQVYQTMIANAQ